MSIVRIVMLTLTIGLWLLLCLCAIPFAVLWYGLVLLCQDLAHWARRAR